MLASKIRLSSSGLSFDIILNNFFKPTLSSGVCLHEYIDSHQSTADVTQSKDSVQMAQHVRVRIIMLEPFSEIVPLLELIYQS